MMVVQLFSLRASANLSLFQDICPTHPHIPNPHPFTYSYLPTYSPPPLLPIRPLFLGSGFCSPQPPTRPGLMVSGAPGGTTRPGAPSSLATELSPLPDSTAAPQPPARSLCRLSHPLQFLFLLSCLDSNISQECGHRCRWKSSTTHLHCPHLY